jgi:hypothetical protein
MTDPVPSKSAREINQRSRKRALNALALRQQGLTFEKIGQQIGLDGPVTKQVARQAVKKGERIGRYYHSFVENPALPTRCCCGAAEFSDIHKVSN